MEEGRPVTDCDDRVRKHLRLMYAVANRLLMARTADVEDAVASARLAFLENCYAGLIQDTNVGAYLGTQVRWQCGKILKEQRREGTSLDVEEPDADLPSPADRLPDADPARSPEKFLLKDVLPEILAGCLNDLSPEQRTIILLDADGLTDDIKAEKLNIPPGTVKSRLYMARKNLRQGLEQKGYRP